MKRVIVEVIHSNIYICIHLKLHDSEHVCSEENIGLPDWQWRTKIKTILNIFIFVPEIRRVCMGLEQHGGVNYDHFHFLAN